MADGSHSPAESQIGDQLELLLAQLEHSGFSIGPRERANAVVLVADLLVSGHVQAFPDLKPWLSPLLARSALDQERFAQVFELVQPVSHGGGPVPPPQRRREAPREVWTALGLIAVCCVAILLVRSFPQRPSVDTSPKPAPLAQRVRPSAAAAPTADATATSSAALNRIATAAERFEDAPTIDEIAPALARDSSSGWSAPALAARLSELSGLPRSIPLALYGPNARDGRTWARLALALDRIERPGREDAFATLLGTANASLSSLKTERPVYTLAAKLDLYLKEKADPSAIRQADLVKHIQSAEYLDKNPGTRLPVKDSEARDELTIVRAVGIAPDPRWRRTLEDTPWAPQYRRRPPPSWIAWLFALVPLALAAMWFARSLTLRKAYLRRRPPELPPLHLDIVADAANRLRHTGAIFQKAAQKLRQRTSQLTSRVDLERSILATMRAGGELFVPVYESARHMPEYLAIIERKSAADQDARRLRELVRSIEALVPVTVLYYRTEPSHLEYERGGRSIAIEQAAAAFPEHRLLILGSGAEFLDPGSLLPHPGVAKLAFWPQRALLTPLPLGEWGREELTLAEQLQLPIGRATPEGLLVLSDLLGLDGNAPDTLIDPSGDGVARALPPLFRSRPQRFLYRSPPSGVSIEQTLQDLRNYLDGPGLEWLCALAVYPSVQWDLTLFLGANLAQEAGGDAAIAPLYSEARIAALTQLPWLRQGTMPNWLRRALIAQLSPRRAAEVRTALQRLIQAAVLSGDERRDEAIKLRIAHESSKERLPPQELYDDEVLLDFLARGRIEDFAISSSPILQQIIPRRLLDRIGVPELAAGLVAGAYALAAFWIVPKPDDGVPPTGAWLPIALLAAGALAALIVSNPPAALRALRALLVRGAPYFLAFPPAVLLMLVVAAGKIALVASNPIAAFAIGVATFVPLIRVARPLTRLFGIPVVESARPPLQLLLLDCARAALLLVTALITGLLSLAPSLSGGAEAGLTQVQYYASALSLAAFVAAWFAARVLPQRPSAPRPLPAGTGPRWAAGALRTALALLPILPAAWLSAWIQATSVRLQSVAEVTAVAALENGSVVAAGTAAGTVHLIDPRRGTDLEVGVAAMPVTSLSLVPAGAAGPGQPARLAVASTDGRIGLYDVTGTTIPLDGFNTTAVPSKPLVALGPDGRLLAAIETDIGEVKLVSDTGSTTLRGSGPVTALTEAGNGLFAFATLDGNVRLVEARVGATPRLSRSSTEMRVPGQIRSLVYDSAARMLTGLGDDGTVVTARVEYGELRDVKQAEKNAKLAFGAPSRWQAAPTPAAIARGDTKPNEAADDNFEGIRETKDFYIVPVYFGTDRAEATSLNRMAFSSERARRLTFGRALVTIPKSHTATPAIERPWAVHIPYFNISVYQEGEDPSRHFTLQSVQRQPRDDFLSRVRNRLGRSSPDAGRALVFIHGYNTSLDNALYRAAQIAFDIKFDGALFLYSWPSGSQVASYTYDRESASASSPYLREFLEAVSSEPRITSLSLLAHSMAAGPLLDVLRDMSSSPARPAEQSLTSRAPSPQREPSGAPASIANGQIIFAAPDADADNFTNYIAAIRGLARGITLYAAGNDRSLIASRNFWGGYRAGDVSSAGPLIVSGVDTIDITAASTDALALNHAGYAENNVLLSDIGRLIRDGTRPPDVRSPDMRPIKSKAGIYWRYVPR